MFSQAMQWVQTGNNDAIQTEQTSSPTIWQQFRATQKHQQITVWYLLRVPQTSTHHYLAAAHWWTTNGTRQSSIWQKELEHPSTFDKLQASFTAVWLTPI